MYCSLYLFYTLNISFSKKCRSLSARYSLGHITKGEMAGLWIMHIVSSTRHCILQFLTIDLQN